MEHISNLFGFSDEELFENLALKDFVFIGSWKVQLIEFDFRQVKSVIILDKLGGFNCAEMEQKAHDHKCCMKERWLIAWGIFHL